MQPAALAASAALTRSRPAAFLVLRSIRLLAGLAVFAMGLAAMVRAGLGLSSWDVLHDGLRLLTPLSFGSAIVVVSIVVVVVSAALGVRPGPATIANMILVGAFADLFLASSLFRDLHAGSLAARLLVTSLGILVIAFGTALYIGAGMGAGPRDSLMLALSERLHTSPGSARSVLELSVLVVGIIAGGRVGIGTIAFAVLIGPAIDQSFTLLRMQPAGKRHTVLGGLGASTVQWLRAGQLGANEELETARHVGTKR